MGKLQTTNGGRNGHAFAAYADGLSLADIVFRVLRGPTCPVKHSARMTFLYIVARTDNATGEGVFSLADLRWDGGGVSEWKVLADLKHLTEIGAVEKVEGRDKASRYRIAPGWMERAYAEHCAAVRERRQARSRTTTEAMEVEDGTSTETVEVEDSTTPETVDTSTETVEVAGRTTTETVDTLAVSSSSTSNGSTPNGSSKEKGTPGAGVGEKPQAASATQPARAVVEATASAAGRSKASARLTVIPGGLSPATASAGGRAAADTNAPGDPDGPWTVGAAAGRLAGIIAGVAERSCRYIYNGPWLARHCREAVDQLDTLPSPEQIGRFATWLEANPRGADDIDSPERAADLWRAFTSNGNLDVEAYMRDLFGGTDSLAPKPLPDDQEAQIEYLMGAVRRHLYGGRDPERPGQEADCRKELAQLIERHGASVLDAAIEAVPELVRTGAFDPALTGPLTVYKIRRYRCKYRGELRPILEAAIMLARRRVYNAA